MERGEVGRPCWNSPSCALRVSQGQGCISKRMHKRKLLWSHCRACPRGTPRGVKELRCLGLTRAGVTSDQLGKTFPPTSDKCQWGKSTMAGGGGVSKELTKVPHDRESDSNACRLCFLTWRVQKTFYYLRVIRKVMGLPKILSRSKGRTNSEEQIQGVSGKTKIMNNAALKWPPKCCAFSKYWLHLEYNIAGKKPKLEECILTHKSWN